MSFWRDRFEDDQPATAAGAWQREDVGRRIGIVSAVVIGVILVWRSGPEQLPDPGDIGVDELFGQNGNDVITGSAFSDLIFGNAGDDFVNGGFGFDRINGGTGADKFFHAGADGHGSDWIQDYSAAEGDVLVFGIASASASDFVVRTTHTESASGERAGDDAVQEAFVNYIGQTLWALVDGDGEAEINLQIGGEVFDLLA